MSAEISGQEDPNKKDLPNGGRPFCMIAVGPDGKVMVSGWVEDEMITDWLLASAARACQALREKKIKIQRVNESAKGFNGFISAVKNGVKR